MKKSMDVGTNRVWQKTISNHGHRWNFIRLMNDNAHFLPADLCWPQLKMLGFRHGGRKQETVTLNRFRKDSCNAPICPWLAVHRVSSCGTHSSRIHSRKTRFSACGTSRCCWPCPSQPAKKLAQKSNKVSSETLVHVSWCMCLLDRCIKTHVIQTRFVLDRSTRSCRCERVIPKWMTICATGTPILHSEASLISAETGLLSRERTPRRDLEPNLSQMLHSF